MAKFKVYHIDRNGHVERTFIRAETEQLALQEAKKRFDDVIKVKRDTPNLTGVFVALSILVVLIILLFVV